MSDLNRRALELMGWRVRYAESDEFGDWYDMIPPNSDLVIPVRAVDEDEAWRVALESGDVPSPAGDPAAAIALLAGVRWTHYHSPNGIQMPGCYEYTDRVVIEDAHAHYAANANTFAEAACAAWCQWREAGDANIHQ